MVGVTAVSLSDNIIMLILDLDEYVAWPFSIVVTGR